MTDIAEGRDLAVGIAPFFTGRAALAAADEDHRAVDAQALIVARHGTGGRTGMRPGSVVPGLLHRAPCPVIAVPAG
ncbi:universal stress protein [Streptomyces sp. NPDC059928]|uniref:universal stress protein n=1 Tax=unclassified Streptomyces TaxID=2593676 RepID=UPI0036571F5C